MSASAALALQILARASAARRSTLGQASFASVNGARLYYELHGSGPPLLLLHGIGHDHRMWSPQLQELSRHHTLVSYDARGCGRSVSGRARFRPDEDAAALCAHLQLGPVLAVGHAIGACHLLELAEKRPELVRGCVALCPSGLRGLAYPPNSGQQWAADLGKSALAMPAPPRLEAVSVPCLVVTGRRDSAYHDSVGRALTRAIPNCRHLELERAGHLANADDPDAVNHAILAFAALLA